MTATTLPDSDLLIAEIRKKLDKALIESSDSTVTLDTSVNMLAEWIKSLLEAARLEGAVAELHNVDQTIFDNDDERLKFPRWIYFYQQRLVKLTAQTNPERSDHDDK